MLECSVWLKVLPACERAAELAPESYAIRDSRGIARAAAGDLEVPPPTFEPPWQNL